MIEPFLNMKTASIALELADPLKVDITGEFANSDDAEKAFTALETAISLGKTFVAGAAEKDPSARMFAKSLDSLKPKRSGSTVTLNAEIDSSLIMGAMMWTVSSEKAEQSQRIEQRAIRDDKFQPIRERKRIDGIPTEPPRKEPDPTDEPRRPTPDRIKPREVQPDPEAPPAIDPPPPKRKEE